MVGRVAASAIASASRLSFFCGLDVRTHIFGRYETHSVPLRRQLAAQVMRAATRFHRYHGRGPSLRKGKN